MPWGWAALVGRESGEREEQAEKGRDEREPADEPRGDTWSCGL